MFEPQNDLEHSLMRAATDPSQRPQFYRDLLAADIYLINVGGESLDIQDGVLSEGSNVQMQSWRRDGEDWLPIFSSLPRLQECLQTESTYLQLNAKSFFEITRGAHVILNPNLDYGKEFTATEIEGMLDGSIFRTGQGYTAKQDTKVLIGQPAEYPTALVKALSRLFVKHRDIKAGYLAHFFNPERDERPHTLIGIDATGDWDSIVGDAGMVAKETLPENEIVDFVRVSADDTGVSQYMLHGTKPFYKKSFLRNVFG
ncbi:MAG: enhanced serine sensitivity protein SseB C-terminal domain-containing protein [Planctomycetota bacterium]